MEDRQVKKIELLSPAGDLHRLKTAVDYGADAVYIGGQRFSLRSRASNFSMEDIYEACDYARARNAAVHVTVNMVPHDEDFEGLKDYLAELEKAGVKAVIVASPAIMKLAKEVTQLEVHCSTQMSVTNADAAVFLKDHLHIDRVVLARECTLDQVRKITEKCGIETEAFIHGGMCVNYSGRCTLSNRMTLRDANRGGCAQSCRWRYRLYEDETLLSDDMLFTMGSKDLLSAAYIYDLIECGVSSLKIEGRMKKEYYIASTISAYRHLIDEIYESGKRPDPERMAFHEKNIGRSGNRAFWSGFYENPDAKGSIIYKEEHPADSDHEILAKVVSYNREKQEALIESRNAFSVGEEVEILSPHTSCNERFVIENMEDEFGMNLERSKTPMRLLKIPVKAELFEGDIIRRIRE